MATAQPNDEQRPAGAQDFKFPDEIDAPTNVAGDDEIEVEIVDDTPAEERNAPPKLEGSAEPTDEELEGYSDKVRNRIDKLTHARRDEERRANAAERRAQEAENLAKTLLERHNAITKSHNSQQETLVTSAREKAEAELVAARAALASAHENFDTAKIVEAQERLSRATLRAEAAANFKATPLQEAELPVQTRQPQQQAAPEPDEKSLNWQRANQWFGTDEEATSFALGVHQKLLKDGVDPRSDDYYSRINARMKQKFPELFSREQERPQSGEQTAPRRQPATVVAPATRSTGPRKIVLSKTQQQLAARLGLTNQQYAAALAKQENQ